METDVAVEKFRQLFESHCEDSLFDGVSDTAFAEACARSGLVATDEVDPDGGIVFKLRAEPFWELGRVLEASTVRDRWSVDWYFRWGLAHGYEFVSSTYRKKEDYLG